MTNLFTGTILLIIALVTIATFAWLGVQFSRAIVPELDYDELDEDN